MFHYLFILCLFLLTACNNNSKTDEQGFEDTRLVQSDSGNTNQLSELKITRGSYEDDNYHAIVYSRFMIPEKLKYDSTYYLKENILSVKDRKTKRNFQIAITDACSYGAEVQISNVTSMVGLTFSVFQVVSPDCSDYKINGFYKLAGDSLSLLFDVVNVYPIDIKRKNESTLIADVRGPEELLGTYQDYQVQIRLPDFVLTEHKPARQEIKFESIALNSFTGETINGHSKEPFFIRAGQELMVDSLFRDTQEVLLKVGDSYIICPVSAAKGNLQGETAG